MKSFVRATLKVLEIPTLWMIPKEEVDDKWFNERRKGTVELGYVWMVDPHKVLFLL